MFVSTFFQLSENALPDNRVKIINLPSSEIAQREKEICSVAGWGITETSKNVSVNHLRVVNVSIVNSQICEKKWKNKLPPNVICAGGYHENKGFCQVWFLIVCIRTSAHRIMKV